MLSGDPRIPLPGRDELAEEQRRVYDDVVSGPRGTVVGPIRAAIHNAVLADRWSKFGETLRYNTVFPPALSELAILMTARRWNSELEWTVHAHAARRGGLSDAVIEAIRTARVPEFESEAEREVYEYVRMIQNDGQVSDEAHAAVTARWGVLGVVELTALTGYYTMVAMTLNAHRVPLPPDEPAALFRDGESHPGSLCALPAAGDATG
ncbi:carboxymuconolactone decarboxylase family protein [Rhodobacterales bacterium HKCCE2091]|nr:carboxymuconolactone decarboxylase family protein [Rhodobacterales bacterium HKCCE2091]